MDIAIERKGISSGFEVPNVFLVDNNRLSEDIYRI
jgi:hypothetical protein